jgi:hypothetical protein
MVDQFKNRVNEALLHRYGAERSFVYFDLSQNEAKKNRFFEILNIVFENNPDFTSSPETSDLTIFRLPQTRIYHYQYCSSEKIIDILTFPNQQFLGWIHVGDSILRDRITSNEKIKCYVETENTIIIADNEFEIDKAIANISTKIQKEYSLNPCRLFSGSDTRFLKKLDTLWSQLSEIDSDGRINLHLIGETNGTNFIWLNEILIQLSYFAALDHFYQDKKQTTPLKEITQARFVDVCKTIGVTVSPNCSIQKIQIENWALKALMKPRNEPEALEAFWSQWHFPALKFSLNKYIKRNDDQAIAIVLLAKQFDKPWARQFAQIVENHLSEDKRIYYQLINLLYDHFHVFYKNNGMEIKESLSDNSIKFQSLAGHLSYISEKRKNANSIFCHFAQQLQMKINRPFRLNYQQKNKTVHLLAPIDKHIAEKCHFKTIQIKIDGHLIELPLIYREFTIIINSIRLKFLLKKKRYQVSVKLPGKETLVSIAGSELSAQYGKYQKIYIENAYREPVFSVSLIDLYGLTSSHCAPQNRFVYGCAVDYRGLYVNHMRLCLENDKKSTDLRTDIFTEAAALTVDCSKQNSLKIKKGMFLLPKAQSKPCLPAFLYEPAEKLKNLLVVYLDTNDENEINATRRRLLDKFGFLPLIKIGGQRKMKNNKYHLSYEAINTALP